MTCRSVLDVPLKRVIFSYVTAQGDIADQSCHGVFAEE